MNSPFVDSVMSNITARNSAEPEFFQAVQEVVESLEPIVQKKPEIAKLKIIERLVEETSDQENQSGVDFSVAFGSLLCFDRCRLGDGQSDNYVRFFDFRRFDQT